MIVLRPLGHLWALNLLLAHIVVLLRLERFLKILDRGALGTLAFQTRILFTKQLFEVDAEALRRSRLSNLSLAGGPAARVLKADGLFAAAAGVAR